MSGYGNETMPRQDDQRRATGHRVLFDKETQIDAWYTAKMLKRLTPYHVRTVRLLAEQLIILQAEQDIEKGDK